MSWSMRDLNTLIEKYPYTPNEVLAKELGRTIPAITGQAVKQNIKKNPSLFSIYRGENEIAYGTIEEIAEQMGVKYNTAAFYAYSRGSQKRHITSVRVRDFGSE